MCWTSIPLPWGFLQYLWSVLFCLFMTGLARLPLPIWVCWLYLYCLVIVKETIHKAIPHLKNSCSPAFKSELNKGISRAELCLWPCSCCGQPQESIQAIYSICILTRGISWESEVDRHQWRLAFLLLRETHSTAYMWHHPWSHYSLASSQEKLKVLRLMKNIPHKVGASCTLLKKKTSFSPSINFWPVQPRCAHYSSFNWHLWQYYKTVICTGARLSALWISIVEIHCTLTLQSRAL